LGVVKEPPYSQKERKDNMTTHKLLKILDNTFPDVEFDIFTDTEGLVRVNFVVDDEPEDE